MTKRTLGAWSLSVFLSLGVLLVPGRAGADVVKAVSGGGSHTCALTTGGGVKCWGSNSSGRLGDGTTTDRLSPTNVSGLTSGVAAIAAGESHSCAVTTTGTVKCWGYGGSGRLGNGAATSHYTPVNVSTLTHASHVGAGYAHTCATELGWVRCWGDNTYGQLGNATNTDSSTPVSVSGLAGVASIALGENHTCALTTAGAVKCWGYNNSGQLGNGSTTDRTSPGSVSGLASGVAAIAAGHHHTCALTTGGGVKCWGENGNHQLGDGTGTDRLTPIDVSGLTSGVAAIAAGDLHTCAVMTGGDVRCWGNNGQAQLGDGTLTSRSSAVAVPRTAGVAAIAAGSYHTCALTNGGGVKCWGSNDRGELGNGTTSAVMTPVPVTGATNGLSHVAGGNNHSCALTTGGGVKCWGANDFGQVGDGTTAARHTPTSVAGLAGGVASIALGDLHACALTTGGGVKCWGEGLYGRLGDDTAVDQPTPVDVLGLTSGVAAVAAGRNHTCAVTTAGAAKCWGHNGDGQLGNNTTTNSYTPVSVSGLGSGVASIAAGYYHSCAVTSGGAVKCWGRNGAGQLGDNSTTDRLTPVSVSGLASGVADVVAGDYHTCALTTGGGVKCWGGNISGQLGDGTGANRSTPVSVSGLSSGVAAITAGGYHTCAVTTAGALKCWGLNSSGQLGDGTYDSREAPTDVSGLTSGVASVGAGVQHTCAVTTGGAVRCWGTNERGQLGNLSFPPSFTFERTLGLGAQDFDADDLVDVAVYRPSSGTWFSLDSSAGNTTMRYRGWGVNAWGDTPVVGDFDGDGVLDPTVFRPGTGTWFILLSRSGFTSWTYFGWGNYADTLVPGDYDGDGRTDGAIYRPSEGRWYVLPSSGGSWNMAFGNSTDQPVAGDFDGDGKRDLAVYRASTGTWFWLPSSTNYTTLQYKGWGVNAQGDTPAPGDYDGDGKTDLCVFRPSTGTWYVLKSSTSFTTWTYFGWGTSGDAVVPADYDGDGKTDGAVYRASNGTWYISPSSGAAQWSKVFGSAGDVPLVTIR